MTQEKTAISNQEETINSSDEQQLIRENLHENELSHVTGGLDLCRVGTAAAIAGGCTAIGLSAGSVASDKNIGRNMAIGTTSGIAVGGVIADVVDKKLFRGEGITKHVLDHGVELAQHARPR